MPVVWPTLLDLSRDECKRVLRKLELEAYAGVISALRAQGDLTKEKRDLLGELSRVLSISTERHRAEVRRAVNDERLTTIAHNMSGPNSSSEWSIEGRRLVPLMPRLVPQTAFTVTANAVANAALQHNASLPSPAETGSKEVVVCYSYTTTTSTPTSTPVPSGSVATVKSPRPASPASNVVVLPSGSAVYVKSVSCSDEDEKPRKRRRTNSSSSSPVLLKEVPKTIPPVTKTITVPVGGSPKMSSIMQSIANSLPPHMSPVKITFTKPSSTQTTTTTTQKVIIVTTSPSSTFVPNILSKSHNYAAVTKLIPTSVIASTTQKQPVVITASQSALVNNSTTTATTTSLTAGNCSTPSSTPSTIAVTTVVSSTPSVVMSTVAQGKRLVYLRKKGKSCSLMTLSLSLSLSLFLFLSLSLSLCVCTQATYTRPTVSPSIGARVTGTPGAATYVKTTSGSIITVVPKSLATLGGKIISSNLVSGTTTKITTIPVTSKPNVIVVQKTAGKGTTIQGLPGKNVVTTLLNAGGEKTIQTVPAGAKPAIITATRPITKMIVTQPKGIGSGVQPATKIIPTKIVYGQQGKTQVCLIFLARVPTEMALRATSGTRAIGSTSRACSLNERPLTAFRSLPFLLLPVSHRSQSHQPSSEPHRTLLQHVAQSQTATQTSVVVKSIPTSSAGAITHIMQQALSSHTAFTKHSEQLGTEEGEVEDTLDPQTGLFYRSALTQVQKQQKLSQAQLEQTQLQVKTLQCFQAKQKQTIHLQAEQLAAKMPQLPQLSIRHQKLAPLQQDLSTAKLDAQQAVARERQLPTLVAQPQQTVVQVLAVKATQQLPKLQQAPTAQKIYVQPQSQLQLPAAPEKQPASQVHQPIITQGSSVTKITFEGHQPPMVSKVTPPLPTLFPGQLAAKTAVADILKMSMMEAQIEPSAGGEVARKACPPAHPPGEAESSPTSVLKAAPGGAPAMGTASVLQQVKTLDSNSSSPGTGLPLQERKPNPLAPPTASQFIRIQNVAAPKAEELAAEILIQTIPQYSVACHSTSNVVVEPSGLLEMNNFTSQRLDEEDTVMEQDMDSSNEDGTEPSPMQISEQT
uniref:BRCA2-interacting transcriptional repressor EMSY n=1 Tax=Pseudonaja textilis TaxID=8673 RepID=A0A670ZM98_PSETE